MNSLYWHEMRVLDILWIEIGPMLPVSNMLASYVLSATKKDLPFPDSTHYQT